MLPDDVVSLSEAITLISPSLALVRPIGMSDSAAEEWLSVAAGELVGYKRWSVQAAAAHARKTCNHHGQIIPAMMKHMESSYPHFNAEEIHKQRNKVLAAARASKIDHMVTRLIEDTASKMRRV